MKPITFTKDKSSIKYYLLAIICVACVYSCKIVPLFDPLFERVYYGNLVETFNHIANGVLWLIEFLILFFVCKKLKIEIFSNKETKKQELPLWRLIILYALVIIPMFAVSVYLGFQIKIVYQLGMKVTSFKILENACEIGSWLSRMLFIVLFIHFIHLAVDKNFKFNKSFFNKYFPFGGIFSILIFGLLDFFFFTSFPAWFYLICTFWYGIIYLATNRKFLITYILSLLIWLL